MNREQLAWAAGILDGEGYFGIRKQKHTTKDGIKRVYRTPLIEISQTIKYNFIPEVIERMENLFQGSKVKGPYEKKNTNHADYYEWGIYGFERFQNALCMIWPWLSNRKKQDALVVMKEYLSNRPPMEWRQGPKNWHPPKGWLDNRKRDALGRLLPNG